MGVHMECRTEETKDGKIIKHNKFYDVYDNGDGTLMVHYGAFGAEGKRESRPLSEWEDIVEKRREHDYTIIPMRVNEEQVKRTNQLERVNSLMMSKMAGDAKVLDCQKRLRAGQLLNAEDMVYLNEVYEKLEEK